MEQVGAHGLNGTNVDLDVHGNPSGSTTMITCARQPDKDVDGVDGVEGREEDGILFVNEAEQEHLNLHDDLSPVHGGSGAPSYGAIGTTGT